MILHTINKAPSQADVFHRCLSAIQGEDSLLLLENAVYAANAGHSATDQVAHIASRGKVFVLANDYEGRGLNAEQLIQGVQLVGFEEFVALTCEHEKTIAWF